MVWQFRMGLFEGSLDQTISQHIFYVETVEVIKKLLYGINYELTKDTSDEVYVIVTSPAEKYWPGASNKPLENSYAW